MYDKQSHRSACAYAQYDQSLCLSFEYSMTVNILTEHHFEFQSLTGGCKCSFAQAQLHFVLHFVPAWCHVSSDVAVVVLLSAYTMSFL